MTGYQERYSAKQSYLGILITRIHYKFANLALENHLTIVCSPNLGATLLSGTHNHVSGVSVASEQKV